MYPLVCLINFDLFNNTVIVIIYNSLISYNVTTVMILAMPKIIRGIHEIDMNYPRSYPGCIYTNYNSHLQNIV